MFRRQENPLRAMDNLGVEMNRELEFYTLFVYIDWLHKYRFVIYDGLDCGVIVVAEKLRYGDIPIPNTFHSVLSVQSGLNIDIFIDWLFADWQRFDIFEVPKAPNIDPSIWNHN